VQWSPSNAVLASSVLCRSTIYGSVYAVPTRVAVQVACVTALAALGTMLVVVGALGSGVVCLGGAICWFWYLYRDAV